MTLTRKLHAIEGAAPDADIHLILPYPPSSNRYWRIARNRTYVSSEAREFKAQVKAIADGLGIQPLAGDVTVQIDVYRPQKTGDLSNRIKVLEDSLNGIAYADDKQIVGIVARRHDDKAWPRVEITITALQRDLTLSDA